MQRPHITLMLVVGLAALIIVIAVAWCPPAVCRILHIQTYRVSGLDEYRQFLADEAAFTRLHHVRAVRVDCSDMRDAVVTALNRNQLKLKTSKSDGITSETVHGPSHAWQQGRLLHLSPAESQQELDSWAKSVRESLTDATHNDLSFLSRLFGGVILHFHNKEIPIVLFSDKPCS
jgi:hypothetical protein